MNSIPKIQTGPTVICKLYIFLKGGKSFASFLLNEEKEKKLNSKLRIHPLGNITHNYT
jgi:hypothetical protein